MGWYENFAIVGMVDIRASKKQKEESKDKHEPKATIDEQSIGFHKALQAIQKLTPQQWVKIMEEDNNISGPSP